MAAISNRVHAHHLPLVHTVYFLLKSELPPTFTNQLVLHTRLDSQPLLNIIRRSEDTGPLFLELQVAALLDLCPVDLPQFPAPCSLYPMSPYVSLHTSMHRMAMLVAFVITLAFFHGPLQGTTPSLGLDSSLRLSF